MTLEVFFSFLFNKKPLIRILTISVLILLLIAIFILNQIERKNQIENVQSFKMQLETIKHSSNIYIEIDLFDRGGSYIINDESIVNETTKILLENTSTNRPISYAGHYPKSGDIKFYNDKELILYLYFRYDKEIADQIIFLSNKYKHGIELYDSNDFFYDLFFWE